MKPFSLFILACLVSSPLLAQTMPDEINYAPYQSRFEDLSRQTSAAQNELNKSEASLAEIRRFISEMTAHIASLQQEIADAQSSIADHNRALPQLESRLQGLRSESSRLSYSLGQAQAEERALTSRYESEMRILKPLEVNLERRVQQVRELESQLANLQREEKVLIASIDRSQAELRDQERIAREENQEQRRLQGQLNDAEGAVKSVEGTIRHLESQVSPLESSLSSEKSKLQSQIAEVSRLRSELIAARNANDTARASQLEAELTRVVRERDEVQSNIRTLESRISSLETQIRSERAKLSKLQDDIRNIPSRIRQSESREREAISRRSSVASAISRFQSDLSSLQYRLRSASSDLNSAVSAMRSEESAVLRQQQIVEAAVRSLDAARERLENLNAQFAQNEDAIKSTSSEIQERNRAIPTLEAQIRNDRKEIAEGEKELAAAKNDERQMVQTVASQRSRLQDLTNQRNGAENEMTTRVTLFNRYLEESQNLGRSQTAIASELGNKEGNRLVGVIAKTNGEALGSELGLAEAKYWGLVRGEIQGYDKGYLAGRASAEDMARGKAQGESKGISDAQIYAQNNLKPVFFEEILQAEFKRPLRLKIPLQARMKNQRIFSELIKEDFRNEVSPLTPAEISRSEMLLTPLDPQVTQVRSEIKTIEGKVTRLADANLAFIQPTTIPFQTVNCSAVYKNVKAFKDACEASYKQQFSMLYLQSAKSSFTSDYKEAFQRITENTQVQKREGAFDRELAAASVVGEAQGLKIGKEEIFQENFKKSYELSYKNELPQATEKARSDAGEELRVLKTQKPLLTLSAQELKASDFRAGEEIAVRLQIKNISSVASNYPVMVRLSQVENADIVLGNVVQNSAQALALTNLPLLKVKVRSSAKSGERVVVKGSIDLPGDLYRTTRSERFELSQVLSANPASNMNLDYNKTPAIKGVFSRYVHTLAITIAPELEDLPQGYTVKLKVLNAESDLMEFKQTESTSRPLKRGEKQELNLSYLFTNKAKGKVVTLELAVEYGGKVVRTEKIELRPH